MNPVQSPRTSCVLQGAVRTATVIGGVIPIVHATSGCALSQYLGGCLSNGGQGGGQIGGLNLPSTNIIEKHVIFGGSSRLREQLKNTVRVLEGELYFVVSGCAPDLVGDDSNAMTEEIKDQGYPVVYLQASGFLGNAYLGYQLAFKAIVDFVIGQTGKSPKKIKGLVNIFGIVPGQDSFWQGDLLELSNSLSMVGLIPNPLLGVGQTLENWKKIPQAELNLAVSPWGIEIAQYLEKKLGIPYIERIYLPIGVDETNELFLEISRKINLNEQILEKVTKDAKDEFSYFLELFADAYFNFNFQVEFLIVGTTSQAIGISRFLSNTLGLIPKALIITDNPPDKVREIIEQSLPEANDKSELLFTEDLQEIHSSLKRKKAELILASTLEKDLADELGLAHLSISFPIGDRIILNRGYAGYSGGLNLVEDVGSALIITKKGG